MSELVVNGTWIALDYAMLCLDCEVSFDLRAFARCPKCGCESEVLLARFLQERAERPRRVTRALLERHAAGG